MTIVTDLLSHVNTVLDHYAFDGYHAVAGALSLTLTTLLVIYFAGLGWLVIRGILPITPMVVGWHMVKAALVVTLALHWDYFSYFFVDFFTHGADRLIGVILSAQKTPQDAASIVQNLDQIWETGSRIFADVWRASGTEFLLGTLMGLIGYAALTGMVSIAVFYLAMAKIALSALLMIAPMILPLYLWQPTRALFNGWLQLLTHWMITPLFVYVFLGIYLMLIQNQLNSMLKAVNGPTTASISGFVLMAIVVMATLRQANEIARHLTKKIALRDAVSFGETIPGRAFSALRRQA